MPIDPLSVYQDFDHSYYPTEVQPHHLPVWEDSTEHLKAQIGFQAGLCFGGYSFTVNVHPHMEEGWTAEGVDYARIIQKRMHAELVRAGLGGLPLFYIIEGRSKSGKSRTKLHIHGYFLTEDPIVSSRMVKVFQRALRREQDGTINEDTNGWDCEPSYDFDDPIWGPGRWVRYSLKNVLRKDDRLTGKRTYMSQSLTQIAREFWLFVRGEPVGKRPQRQQKAPSLEKALRLIEPR